MGTAGRSEGGKENIHKRIYHFLKTSDTLLEQECGTAEKSPISESNVLEKETQRYDMGYLSSHRGSIASDFSIQSQLNQVSFRYEIRQHLLRYFVLSQLFDPFISLAFPPCSIQAFLLIST